ncbi:hypothetical protein NQ314_012092 [Rhamnusium bicolor]|uniref:Coiled-coil protein 142 C-terminal domain-containing protein n=1 Tax=Rhamnusium bicolor TaxID=1586634 RepID=A0AAV8XEH3_9CUCU|nr:hypothetical protein NQ314_012092 [Rhamnusium bicolor]
MADIPSAVLSALASLADALGVHVTSTCWDQNFRLALVASKTTCNPDTGKLFSIVLQDLVMLCNQCEVTPDWIVGAPLDELPLVEQIPVLHRLGKNFILLMVLKYCVYLNTNFIWLFVKISKTDTILKNKIIQRLY